MTVNELDPDVVRWGLHLLDVCSVGDGGLSDPITCCDKDSSRVEYEKESYSETKTVSVDNDEIIAYALQEELSRVAAAEAIGLSDGKDHQRASVLAQDWSCLSPGNESHNEDTSERENSSFCLTRAEPSVHEINEVSLPEVVDESILDSEVEKRLNQMLPVPHIPKVNGDIPTVDEATTDHQRLLERLQLYDLVELKVSGDGNCQFRSLSDQIYRTTDHHKFVRQQVVQQLKTHPELYKGYVPMAYDDYLKKMGKNGEWGDHVTLQAAADTFGVKIFILTSFKDTCYIEILPHIQKSERIIFLSFWAEVHYNSIYPLGELPHVETKKKNWWRLWLGS